MKKTTLLASLALTVISITAFGFMNWQNPNLQESKQTKKTTSAQQSNKALKNEFISAVVNNIEPDFNYQVGSRFIATVSKERLQQAKSVVDLLPEEATRSLKDYSNVQISLVDKEGKVEAFSINEALNLTSIDLLKELDYSSNFHISALCKRDVHNNGMYSNYKLTYYLTVVPEKEAMYRYGKVAFLNYLKKSSKPEIVIAQKDQLQPGKISFVVAKNGNITNTVLESTSGYETIDKKMITLIENLSGQWEPATNSLGETVDQQLVFSYGTTGC